ncbi:MAG: TonB-dependent receptor [Verrucomicrobia bacterium]|nr:TonB-dependent receptor [Verrucomicrobiota bacterium]
MTTTTSQASRIGRPRAASSRWTALAALLFGFVLAVQSAAGQETLTGTVTNSATGQNLLGARVVLKGTGREVFTDSMGVYRFPDVAPGSVIVSVSYTGLNPMDTPVLVTAGGRNRADVGLTADIYRLDKFVVAGEREGNAQAITLQRQSSGVKSIVSADAFGTLAGNPAELVSRLPGVEGVACDGDTRYIRMRGLSQELNTITMDGNRLADAGSAGTSRSYQFQQISSDSIERMEVVKSPTPDMDGDSIGGNVNLVSKSAFDSSPERRIRGSFGAIWRPFDPRETRAPRNYSLSYSEVFGGKIGVSINAAYRVHNTPQDTIVQAHQQLPNDVAGPAYTYSAQLVDFRNERARTGAGVKLDYKLSDNIRFYLNTTSNKIVEHENDRYTTFATGQAIATRDAAGNLTGTGGIIPGYTDRFTAIRPVTSSTVNIQTRNQYKDGKTVTLQIGGVHRYRNLDLDYDAYKSDSKTNYAGQRLLDYTARGIGFTIDTRDRWEYPIVTQTDGPDITKLESYTENNYSIARNVGWDGYRGAALNVKKQFETAVPTHIKTGLRWREQTRRNEMHPWTGSYVGPDGVRGVNPATGINDDNLAQFGQAGPGRFFNDYIKYPALPHPAFPGRGNNLIDDAIEKTPQYFAQNIAANIQSELTGNTKFKEEVSAFYLMGNMALGKLSVLGGFRVETTKTWGEAALQAISAAERARRAAFVGPLTNDEIRRRNIAEFGGRQIRFGEYRDLLPGLHFKFSPFPALVTRASYATNIGRPSVGQLLPRTNVNYDNQTVSSSNPSLKPQTANNFDATAEYYFEPAGVVSAGVFLKEIKRFIYTAGGAVIPAGQDNGFDGEYAGFTYTTQHNGGFAKVKGLELNYSQQFTFLPGFWSGFGAFANVTVMRAEGNYGAGSAIALAPNPKVAGFNPRTGNAGVSYIKGKVSVRLQANHRGQYLTSFNTNVSRMVYARKRTALDLKTVYYISKQYNVYLDVNNVLSEPDRGTLIGGRPGANQVLTPQFYFGLNTRL